MLGDGPHLSLSETPEDWWSRAKVQSNNMQQGAGANAFRQDMAKSLQEITSNEIQQRLKKDKDSIL